MPATSPISVRTGSRLHFGLWAWGERHPREFGGVGMMLEQPELVVAVEAAPQFEASGPLADRLQAFAERCQAAWGWATLPACRLSTPRVPPQHAGFGLGTQLGLAVTQGLASWHQSPVTSAAEFARIAGRAKRSSVGTYGFLQGGLLVDRGKQAGDHVGELANRVAIPSAWRVVLITPRHTRGVAGEAERAAFAKLPAVPLEVTAELQHLAEAAMVPAAETGDFDHFSQSLFEYGHLAGRCFASVQGGPYASESVESLVRWLRSEGIDGVGQSSWGPTVFAFTRSATEATQLAKQLQQSPQAGAFDLVITKAKNQGAAVGPYNKP